MNHRTLVLFALFAVLGPSRAADPTPLFSEDFEDLDDGVALTTSNTSFTIIKVSPAVGSLLETEKPGFDGGTSINMLGIASSGGGGTSIAAVGVAQNTYTAFDVGTLSFTLQTPTSFANSELYFAVGNGAYFTSSSNASGATVGSYSNFTGALRINGSGMLQTCTSATTGTGSWVDLGSTALTAGTIYNLSFVFNGSTSTVTYGGGSVAAGKGDLWVNGSLFEDDFGIRDATSVRAFTVKMAGTNVANAAYGFDDFHFYDAAFAAVPEPHEYGIALAALLGGAILLRRRSTWSRLA